MKVNIRLSILLALLSLISWHPVMAQFHSPTKRFVITDYNAGLLNVYDVVKGDLLKSFPIAKNTYHIRFGKDNSSLYLLDNQKGSIIDLRSLEIKSYSLIADRDTADVNQRTKLMTQAAENPGENSEALMAAAEKIVFMSVPIALTYEGLGVYQRSALEMKGKYEFWVFDIKSGGKRIAVFRDENLNGNSSGTLTSMTIDGRIRNIDIRTQQETNSVFSGIPADIISQAKKYSTSAKPNLYAIGKYSRISLMLEMDPVTYAFKQYVMYADLQQNKVIHSETSIVNQENQEPVIDEWTSQLYFKKSERIDPNTPAPVLVMPQSPSLEGKKGKELTKALEEMSKWAQEFPELQKKASADYAVQVAAYNSPKNFRSTLYSDANFSNKVLSVDGCKNMMLHDNHLSVFKEGLVEIYDVKTAQLLYTIYLL